MDTISQRSLLDYNDVHLDSKKKDTIDETRSGIVIRANSGQLVEAGFQLLKCESGFRIVVLDPKNDFLSALQLMGNDKLLAIHNVDIRSWACDLVEDFIMHMFDQERNRLTLVIERQEQVDAKNCTVTVIEIEVDFFYPRGPTSMISSCKKRFLSSFTFTSVYCMQITGTDDCLVSVDTLMSKVYLKCETDGTLTMDNLPSRTDTAYHFRRRLFHGFEKSNSENQSCFPCVLQSIKTGKYVSVLNCSSVGFTTKSSQDDLNDITAMTSLRSADSRFFFLKLKTSGRSEYVLESTILKDKYLSWDCAEKRMKLAASTDTRGAHQTTLSVFHIYVL
ncbi:uncharacterized protein LOC132559780 [Ylistrum balloti]|uniref:uncharacterized protein LOC132559780 n=1 Tax=Ylistrum balloti TaxID=509963 RepID=UPI0029058532|nr:uncharacterized protein LOC132559780 [Ylistrum balloti]